MRLTKTKLLRWTRNFFGTLGFLILVAMVYAPQFQASPKVMLYLLGSAGLAAFVSITAHFFRDRILTDRWQSARQAELQKQKTALEEHYKARKKYFDSLLKGEGT